MKFPKVGEIWVWKDTGDRYLITSVSKVYKTQYYIKHLKKDNNISTSYTFEENTLKLYWKKEEIKSNKPDWF